MYILRISYIRASSKSISIDSWIVFALTLGHRAVTTAHRNLRLFPHYVRHYATFIYRADAKRVYELRNAVCEARALITTPSHGCMTNTFGNSITPKGHRTRSN